jgi:hypothetical protein
MFRPQVLLHPAIGVVDPAVQGQLGRPFFERVDRDPLQQRDRIVVQPAPEDRIDLAEQGRGVRVPAPPQVLRQRAQPLVRRRDELPEVRASLTIDASCVPAVDSIRTSSGAKTRGSIVCTTSTPCSSPRSMIGTPETIGTGSSPASRKVLEARMHGGVGDALRRSCSATSRRALPTAACGPADALGPQADRRGEHQVGAIGLEQVDRADVGLEPALDQVDDVRQRLSRVARVAETSRPISSSVQSAVSVCVSGRRRQLPPHSKKAASVRRESAGYRPCSSGTVRQFCPAPGRAYSLLCRPGGCGAGRALIPERGRAARGVLLLRRGDGASRRDSRAVIANAVTSLSAHRIKATLVSTPDESADPERAGPSRP